MKISDTAKRALRLIYLIAVSVLLVGVGVAFIISAHSINSLGDNPYTYESISAAFSRIAPLCYVTLVFLLLGIPVSIFLDVEPRRQGHTVTPRARLKRLVDSRNLSEASNEVRGAVYKQRRLRLVLGFSNIAFFVAGCIRALVFTLDSDNYTGDYNSSVILAVTVIAVSLLPSFIILIVRLIIDDISISKEIAILTELPRSESLRPSREHEEKSEGARVTLVLRVVLLSLSAVFIVLGILNGGMADVVEKAIKICTECIGLG